VYWRKNGRRGGGCEGQIYWQRGQGQTRTVQDKGAVVCVCRNVMYGMYTKKKRWCSFNVCHPGVSVPPRDLVIGQKAQSFVVGAERESLDTQ
jgi:hypothetical protein